MKHRGISIEEERQSKWRRPHGQRLVVSGAWNNEGAPLARVKEPNMKESDREAEK